MPGFHVDRRLGGLGIVSPANTYSSGVLGLLELVDLRELVDQAQCHGNPAENSSRHLFRRKCEIPGSRAFIFGGRKS